MIRRPSGPILAILVALVLAAVLVAAFGGPYDVKLATRIAVFAIFVLGLDLLIGVVGLVSFGHALFFGLGAYAVWAMSPAGAPADALVVFPAAVAIAGVAALVTGALAVRTRGFYFIMVTLAFGQMAYSAVFDTRIAGGSDGATIDVKPVVTIGGRTLVDLDDRAALLILCVAVCAGLYVALVALVRSRWGRVVQAIRWNESRVAELGHDVYAHKLAAFTIAGAIAGLAGASFAVIDGFVTPDLFGWKQSGLAIMMVVLGGVGTLHGAIFGAVVFTLAEELLKTRSLVGPLAAYWSMALGVVLVAVVLVAPRGLAGWLARSRSLDATPDTAPSPAPSGEGLVVARRGAGKSIALRGLSRRFGALAAVDDVSLTFGPNAVHAVIGPNGAGKTTLLDLMSGALAPSAGRILIDGEDVTGLPRHRIARRGVGRSHQRTDVIAPFTAAENCHLAAQARVHGVVGSRQARHEHDVVTQALARAGLATRADVVAAELAHGEQRQLEIAMLVASGADVLLLDEPLGGMGPDEAARVSALVRDFAAAHTVVLIEHDMDAVFALADTVTVMVEGRVIAHGSPDEVRRDPLVRRAYLGSYGDPEVAP